MKIAIIAKYNTLFLYFSTSTCRWKFSLHDYIGFTKIDGGVFKSKTRTSIATLTRAIKRISEAHKASEKGLEDSPHRHPESSKAGQSMAVTNGKEYY